MSNDPDEELIRDCQAALEDGLDGPFKELYQRYRDRVYNVCYRIAGNPTDALDASQETFGTLYRKLGDFRFQSKFSSWVYRIAVNASIDLKRRDRARRVSSLDLHRDDEHGGGFDVEDRQVEMPMASASRHELEAEVQRAIDRLSPKLRAVVVLRYVEGLSYEEVSQVLSLSLGTVKSRLARAHDALDRELSPVLDRHYLG